MNVMVYFQPGDEWEWCIILESDTGILGKKKSKCSYQESNLRPSVTSSDALPLSYKRLVGA